MIQTKTKIHHNLSILLILLLLQTTININCLEDLHTEYYQLEQSSFTQSFSEKENEHKLRLRNNMLAIMPTTIAIYYGSQYALNNSSSTYTIVLTDCLCREERLNL